MFSVGDKVFSNSLNMEGIVNRIDGKMIDVYFEKYHLCIGVERKELVIIEKTTNERELSRTKEMHAKSTKFSFDGDYDVLFTEEKLSISRFIEKLNNYRNPWTNELKYSWVINLLIGNDLLMRNSNDTLVPTENGTKKGIEREYCYIGNNKYSLVNFYNRFAQEYILKLILDSQYDTDSFEVEDIIEEQKEEIERVVENPFQQFYDELLKLRLSLKTGYKNLYYVIPESSLYEVYLNMPTSITELFQINGLAEKRIENYGNQLLGIVNKYIELKEYSKPDINRTLDVVGNIGSFWTKEEEQKLIEELNSGLSIKEISEIHQRSKGAIRSRIKFIFGNK